MSEGQYSFLDILSILSFAIGLANYEENIDQTSMNGVVNAAVNDIHEHLQRQDKNIEKIMQKLEVQE